MDSKLEQSVTQIHLRYQDARRASLDLFGHTTEPDRADDTLSLEEELNSAKRYDREMRDYVQQLLKYLGDTIRQTQPVIGG